VADLFDMLNLFYLIVYHSFINNKIDRLIYVTRWISNVDVGHKTCMNELTVNVLSSVVHPFLETDICIARFFVPLRYY